MEKLQNSNSRPRMIWIDAMKGIGVLFVLLVHSGGICNIILTDFLIAGYMPMFFILSGYTARIETVYCGIRKKQADY